MKIRIATFNVFYGKDPNRIASAIKNNPNLKDADIFLLQEIEAHADEAKERAQAIADDLGLQCVYAPARESGKETKLFGTHGIAILSRFPIKEFQVVPLREYDLRYNTRKRIALNAVLEIDNQLVQVCNVHLDLRINIKDRLDQINDVLKKLDSHHIQKIILGGDFNTVPIYWAGRVIPIFYSNQRSRFHKFLKGAGYQTRLSDIGHTMEQKIVKFSLDSIYTKGVEISGFGVERDVSVSDHKPVWADIEL